MGRVTYPLVASNTSRQKHHGIFPIGQFKRNEGDYISHTVKAGQCAVGSCDVLFFSRWGQLYSVEDIPDGTQFYRRNKFHEIQHDVAKAILSSIKIRRGQV